jgi:hypothetical protein
MNGPPIRRGAPQGAPSKIGPVTDHTNYRNDTSGWRSVYVNAHVILTGHEVELLKAAGA